MEHLDKESAKPGFWIDVSQTIPGPMSTSIRANIDSLGRFHHSICPGQ
jgi:hypothetical protein